MGGDVLVPGVLLKIYLAVDPLESLLVIVDLLHGEFGYLLGWAWGVGQFHKYNGID